jgi:hypothetical protein
VRFSVSLPNWFFDPISKALTNSGENVSGTAKIGDSGGLMPPDL